MQNILFSLKHMMVLCNVYAFNIIALILSWFEITGNETLQKETILIQISIHSVSRSGVNPGQHFSMADGGTIDFLTYWKRTQKIRICCRLSNCLVWFAHVKPLRSIGSKTTGLQSWIGTGCSVVLRGSPSVGPHL